MDSRLALDELRADTALSILDLAGRFSTLRDIQTHLGGRKVSNASSASSLDGRSPSALLEDLQHYQALFSKLRFSYVEQVTKEKFLRAITSDTPDSVGLEENSGLEGKIKDDKKALGEKKEELRGMVRDLEAQGRDLARRKHATSLRYDPAC